MTTTNEGFRMISIFMAFESLWHKIIALWYRINIRERGIQ